jgi:hypothetical protein
MASNPDRHRSLSRHRCSMYLEKTLKAIQDEPEGRIFSFFKKQIFSRAGFAVII